MTIIEITGHLSFVIIAISFLMKDIIWLRIFSIISGSLGITYNFFYHAGPLWINIGWITFFILINIFMIIFFYISSRKSGFTDEDINIWKQNFLGLSAEEYRMIRKITTNQIFKTNDIVITKGQETKYIYFIVSGYLQAKIDEDIIKILSNGDIAGEMSFLTDTPANAHVTARQDTHCISIEKKKLRPKMIRSPSFHVSITNLFNKSLIKKITL